MQVIFGRDEVELDTAGAVEIRAIQGRLKSFMGIPPSDRGPGGWQQGQPGPSGPAVEHGRVIVKEGQKGVGKIWTAQEYCQLFGLTEKDFEKQIGRD